jgi:hypothetical protein
LAQSAETIAARLAESGPTLARVEQTSQRGDSWIDRHPIWTGALVGAGAGAAYGARRCANDGCASRGSGGGALVGAAWGAGFGAMIGLILDAALKDFP